LSQAVGVAAGASHSCALLADGTVRPLGSNDGELGDAPIGPASPPVTGLTNVINISAGSAMPGRRHTTPAAGRNEFGQLGNGTTHENPAVPRGDEVPIAAIAAGNGTCVP
jgi:alpha-tubulin suppressor-like RCC1 family protein